MRKKKYSPRIGIIIVLTLLFSGIGVFLYTQNTTSKEPSVALQQNHQVFYPTQYSDKHITENAILSDSHFKNNLPISKAQSLASVLIPFRSTMTGTQSTEKEEGTWLWTPILNITTAYRNAIISGAKKNGIKNIYLSIDSYLDIYVMPEGKEKEAKKKAFDEIVEGFVSYAHKNEITVDAESGWRNWAEPGNEYKAFAVLAYAVEYNKTHDEKLRGFQYDIEPFMLSDYEIRKKEILNNFLYLIDATLRELDQSDLAFSVVIPEFYDGDNDMTPKFWHGLSFGYTFDHLIRSLDRRAGSNIIIMAYRNYALGDGGIIDISKTEMDEATNHKTKIIIAQETGDIPYPKISFHNMSRAYYEEQLSLMEQSFSDKKSYGGIATHYINTFLALK